MKYMKLLPLVCLVAVMNSVPSFAAINFGGGILFEDFDSLPTSGIGDYYENDADVVEWGFQREVPGSSGWEGTQTGGSKADGSEDGMHLNAITLAGTSTAGTIGSAGTGAGDQAIYSIASASFVPTMGVEIVNTSEAPLTSLHVRFTQELWRTAGDSGGGSPGAQNIIPAEWGTSDTVLNSASFLTAEAGFTSVASLNLESNTPPTPPTPFPVSFLDGNDAANQQLRTASFDLSSTPIDVGESFFLRFADTNDPGRDAALAIDNFYVSDSPIPDMHLEVNRNTGAITLINSATAGGAANIRGYSITSEIGALNAGPGEWKSIANNYDSDSGSGSSQIDTDDNWTILSDQIAGNTDLSEFQFSGSPGDGGAIGIGESVVLSEGSTGSGAAWIPTLNEDDLTMTVALEGTVDMEIEIPIIYVGANSEAIRSDLDHDGDIDIADYEIFRTNNHTSLNGLSFAQQYVRGDLDGDGDNDRYDFLVFKDDFANFPGNSALSVALQAVPEPSSMILLALGTIAFAARKARKPALVIALLLFIPNNAQATDLDLTTFTAEGIAENAGSTWTTTSSTATIDDSNSRGNILYSPGSILGTTIIGTINPGSDDDLIGLALGYEPGDGVSPTADYLLLDWKGQTQALDFTGKTLSDLTPETTANAGLALSRVTGTVSEDETWGHVNLAENVTGGVAELARGTNVGASSYPTDTEVSFMVSYASDRLVVWVDGIQEMDVPGPFADGRLGLYTSSQDTNTPLLFSDFQTFDSSQKLTAIVNQTTGDITIKNNSASPISLDYYELTSEGDSLDSSNWVSLDSTGNDWGTAGGSSDSILSESFLDGVATLAANESLFLEDAYDAAENDMDLVLLFHDMASGLFLDGIIEYTTGPTPLQGDFNADGTVNLADYTVWRDNLGAANEDSLSGNGNGLDGVNAADYALWKANFGNSSGSAVAGIVANVPEPSNILMLAMACAGMVVVRFGQRLSLVPVRAAAAILLTLCVATTASAVVTLDGKYEFGDLGGEMSFQMVGDGLLLLTTFESNSAGPNDLITPSGDPQYADLDNAPYSIGKPFEVGQWGADFDGDGDSIGRSSTGHLTTLGTADTGISMWVYPRGSSNRQALYYNGVNDVGVAITASGNWTQNVATHDDDIEIVASSAVVNDSWAHVMQHTYTTGSPGAPSLLSGSGTGGDFITVLYVNGEAVSAHIDNHTIDADGPLLIGAENPGSVENSFNGIVGDVELYNATDFSLFEDNKSLVAQIASISSNAIMDGNVEVGDINLDGTVDNDDVTSFITGWFAKKRIDGFHGDLYVGDLSTWQQGDIDLDGRVTLTDAILLNNALAPLGGLNFDLLTSGTAVPEPSSLVLLGLAGIAGIAGIAFVLKPSTTRL